MSTSGKLPEYFDVYPADPAESVDFEFFDEHPESILEPLKKDDKKDSELTHSASLEPNNKTLMLKQQQRGNPYKRNGDVDLSDETYHSTEDEDEIRKIKGDGNNRGKSSLSHKPDNNPNKINKKKAVVKDVYSDSMNYNDIEERSNLSSSDITGLSSNETNYQTSRNSPVRQSLNKNDNQKKQTKLSFHSPNIYNVNNERINVDEIADALKTLNKKVHRLHIRPPWKDPNSKPLPSDQTIAFYNMYEDYLKYQSQRPSSSLSCSAKFLHDEIAVRRLYHSTLNRLRQNEKIQIENYELAKRLKNIRPTTGMTREEQLRDYKKYFITPNSLYAYQKSESTAPCRKLFPINHKHNNLKSNELKSKSVNSDLSHNNNNNKHQTNSINDNYKNNLKRLNKDAQGQMKLEHSYNSNYKHESDSSSSTLNHQVNYSKQSLNTSKIIRHQQPPPPNHHHHHTSILSSTSSLSGSFNSSSEVSVKL
ncbi:unnamed protein product [Schistosoma turkestanicum]|nr:unnamed protein product [Schistosoma turkestanicum]